MYGANKSLERFSINIGLRFRQLTSWNLQ